MCKHFYLLLYLENFYGCTFRYIRKTILLKINRCNFVMHYTTKCWNFATYCIQIVVISPCTANKLCFRSSLLTSCDFALHCKQFMFSLFIVKVMFSLFIVNMRL